MSDETKTTELPDDVHPSAEVRVLRVEVDEVALGVAEHMPPRVADDGLHETARRSQPNAARPHALDGLHRAHDLARHRAHRMSPTSIAPCSLPSSRNVCSVRSQEYEPSSVCE